MFAGTGTLEKELVRTSHVRASFPRDWPSERSIRESGSRLLWTTTIGRLVSGETSPVTAGLPGLALLKVTETGGAVPVIRWPLSALALMVWPPLANFAVFSEKVAGLVAWSNPTMAPSTRSWMAWRPESGSSAVTVTLTVPVSPAPPAGELTATLGGVVSGGAALKATVWCTQDPAPSSGALPV